jgi:hypothetical protein
LCEIFFKLLQVAQLWSHMLDLCVTHFQRSCCFLNITGRAF